MTEPARNMAQQLKRDVRILQNKIADLTFFTEDFRENNLQINARVLANLDIFNIEFKQMAANKQKIETLETKIDGLQTTIENLLSFLGIEERQRQEVLLVRHRGAAAVPKMRDVEVQVAADVDRVEVKKKDAIVQTKVTQSRDTGIQCSSTSADASVQTSPMATRHVKARLGATAAAHPLGSDVPKEYVTATQRMRAAEGEFGPYGPTLLCTDSGSVEWELSAYMWNGLIRRGGYLHSPHIILPSTLEGGKVRMCLYNSGTTMELRTCMLSDAYNKLTKLPIRAMVNVTIFDSYTSNVVCAGEGDITWTRLGGWINVFARDGGNVKKIQSPTFKFTFIKPQ